MRGFLLIAAIAVVCLLFTPTTSAAIAANCPSVCAGGLCQIPVSVAVVKPLVKHPALREALDKGRHVRHRGLLARLHRCLRVRR
jgi:hypothetical protein